MTDAPDTLLDGSHTVLTPEYVEFRFTLAGLYSRFLAWLMDALIVGGCTMALLLGLHPEDPVGGTHVGLHGGRS